MCGSGAGVGSGGYQQSAGSEIQFIARTMFRPREPTDPAAATQGPCCFASVLSLIGLLQFHLPG